MIDSKLQARLRERFNPDGSELRKMQMRMLNMLKYIDRICRENGIKYWLSSGTCLGAVRHGGFIPWDDDVDIEMLEKDYIKLVAILKKRHDEGYIIQDDSNDPDYIQFFSKLRDLNSEIKEDADTDNWNKYKGCFIDLFILEPSSSRLIHRICGILWNHLLFPLCKIKKTRTRRLCIKLGRRFLTHLFNLLSRITNKPSSESYRHKLGCGFNKQRFREDIQNVIYVPFEETVLPIPVGHEHYLQTLYGDYESIPPMEDIHPHLKQFRLLN